MRIRHLVVIAVGITAANATAQSRIDRNVIYGMYSGLALVMDVHYPDRANGYGVIAIQGSGWNAPLGYNAAPLKDRVASWRGLTAAGYTLFAINHGSRNAPRRLRDRLAARRWRDGRGLSRARHEAEARSGNQGPAG